MSRVWVVFPFGAIRLSTLVAFVVILVIVTWFTRSLLLAVLTGMGWWSAYEIVFQSVALALGREPWLQLFYLVVGVTGWVVAAHLIGIRLHPVLLLVWSLSFVAWAVYGFHYNNYNQPNVFSVGDEIFNVITKDGLAVIYLIGALSPFRFRAIASERAGSSQPAR